MPRKKTHGVPTTTGELAARAGHTGRPSALTDRTRRTILDAVRDGNHITTATALAGISPATLYRWIDAANTVEEAIQNNKAYQESALPYLEFRDELHTARAEAEAMAVRVVRKQILGGYVTHEKPLQDAEGNVMYHSTTGELLVERTTAPPDGRLAMAYLSRSRPGEWSLRTEGRMEVTGPGGSSVAAGADEGATGDQIRHLADRLEDVIRQAQAEAAEDAGEGEIVDGEVVEDGDDAG